MVAANSGSVHFQIEMPRGFPADSFLIATDDTEGRHFASFSSVALPLARVWRREAPRVCRDDAVNVLVAAALSVLCAGGERRETRTDGVPGGGRWWRWWCNEVGG